MYFGVNAVLELLKFYLIYSFGLNLKMREKKGVSVLFVLTLTIIYIVYCNYAAHISFPVYMIWIGLATLILFKYNIKWLLFSVMGMACLLGTIDILSMVCVEIAGAILGCSYMGDVEKILASVLTIVFLIIAYLGIGKGEKGVFKNIGYKYMLQIFLIAFLNSTIFALIWNSLLSGGNKIYAIFLIVVASVYFQLIALVKLAVSNRELQKKDKQNQYFMKVQEEQYAYLKAAENETRKFRHDMANHISVLDGMCKQNAIEDIQIYIEQIWGKMQGLKPEYQVNHSVVNVILNRYAYQFKQQGISFVVEGKLPLRCEVATYDFCTLFSNILQNAYEAAAECEVKEVLLQLKFDDDYIYIRAENTYQGNLNEKDGELLSLKNDLGYHGFGMSNIKDCVLNYNGEMIYKTVDAGAKEKRFLLKIMLCNKKAACEK